MEIVKIEDPVFPKRQRDYLLLTIFLLSQHRQFKRARALVEGMAALDDMENDVILARGVLGFYEEEYALTIKCLDEVEARPPETSIDLKKHTEYQPMRDYLRARSHYLMGQETEAGAIVEKLTAPPQIKKRKKAKKRR